MTTTQYILENWLTFANTILLLGVAFNVGSILSKLKSNIGSNEKDILRNSLLLEKHKNDEMAHSTFEKTADLFVPRKEIDARLKNLEEMQAKIFTQQDLIYKILVTQKKK